MRVGILSPPTDPKIPRGLWWDCAALYQRLLRPYLFEFHIASLGADEKELDASVVDAWLLAMPPTSIYQQSQWMRQAVALVRQASEQGVPMIGVGFAHQLIAWALGGQVGPGSSGWQAGAATYRFNGDLAGLGHQAVYIAHSDVVTVAPEFAQVCALSDGCTICALRFERPILTLQCHPELSHALMVDFLNDCADLTPAISQQAQTDLSNSAVDNQVLIEQIALFLLEHRPRLKRSDGLFMQAGALFGDNDIF